MTAPADRSEMPAFVTLRRSNVEALLEEWADLDEDPFWQPLDITDRLLKYVHTLDAYFHEHGWPSPVILEERRNLRDVLEALR